MMADRSSGAAQPFALLAHALAGMIEREERDLEILRLREAEPRPHGRAQGLEWAISSLEEDLERTRQARELLSALVPVESQVRALAAFLGLMPAPIAGEPRAVPVHFVGEPV